MQMVGFLVRWLNYLEFTLNLIIFNHFVQKVYVLCIKFYLHDISPGYDKNTSFYITQYFAVVVAVEIYAVAQHY